MFKDATLTRWSAVVILAWTFACAQVQAQQPGQRTVRQYPAEPGSQSPLEVVSVKVKGEAVEPGRPFTGGDDWLAGLTIKLKNVADKPISFVDRRLLFPTPAGDKRKSVGLLGLLRYGCWPGYPCYPDASGSDKQILPGQTQDIELTEEAYKRLESSLAQLGARTPVESAEFEIDSAFFDDDTRWSRGFILKRDPAEPNKYKTVGRYVPPKNPE